MRYNLPSMPRTRHPVTRAVTALVGIAAAAVMLVCGVFASAVLLLGGIVFAVWRYWHRTPAKATGQAQPAHSAAVIDGEFVVIRQTRPAGH